MAFIQSPVVSSIKVLFSTEATGLKVGQSLHYNVSRISWSYWSLEYHGNTPVAIHFH